MLKFPPPPPPGGWPKPPVNPPLTMLTLVFDRAYMSQPAYVWSLPLRRQSDEIMRTVMYLCRSLQPDCRGLHYDPVPHGGEHFMLAALANVDPDDIIPELNEDLPNHPFPAARYDPQGRIGRTGRYEEAAHLEPASPPERVSR